MGISTHLYNEDGSAWDAFVASHQDSTNYHQYGWRKVVEKRTMYLAATNRHNEICGILPFVQMKNRLFGSFLVSLPFFTYGGPLISEDSGAELPAYRKSQVQHGGGYYPRWQGCRVVLRGGFGNRQES